MIDFSAQPMSRGNVNALVVRLAGRLDSQTCDYFFSCLQDEIEEGHVNVIVDCQDLEFVSSMGLGSLMRIHSRMKRRGGNVKLARIEGVVAEIFRVVGFDRVLQIYSTVDEAFEAFEA